MNEFVPKLVLDSRIHDISDKVDVAVDSSAAQSTYQNFKSVNNSNSSITFNVNVPSENIAVDRRVLFSTTLKFQVKITNVPVPAAETVNPDTGEVITPAVDGVAFQWGKTDGLGQFPLNALFQQVQATINNVSVSVPIEDVMAPLLRLCNQRAVSRMNSTLTASLIDQNISNLENADEYLSNPLRGMKYTTMDALVQGRGCVNPYIIDIVQYASDGTTIVDDNEATSMISQDPANIFVVKIQVDLVEPFLFLSPFNGLVPSKDEAAFLGINNMNIVCNIKSNYYDLYKTTNSSYTHTVSLGWDGGQAFENPQLLMNLLTLQPEQYSSINTRNVLPIQDYPRYVSTDTQSVSNDRATYTFNFPILQLNQIPDKILIFVKPVKSTAVNRGGIATPDYAKFTQSQYYSITSAQISFNNISGILSSCTQEQLFNISKRNGSQQSYSDFLGEAIIADDDTTGVVPSQGSILVVKPAYDFNLPSFLSGGSLGQFGLQIRLSCKNYTTYNFTQSQMVVITVNNGIMVTQQGSSSLYSGLLTKNMVLETKQQKPAIDSSTLNDLTGGSIQEACHTGLKKVLKKHFGKQPSSGAGMSAGGMSAGGMSAGKQNRMSKYM
jgi:hypothetical protein